MLHEDKRRFMRMMVNAKARLTILETGLTFEGKCHDLSATGLSIEVSEPVEPNTMMEVHINSSSTAIPPLNAHANVVRCAQEQDGTYILGLEITQFN
ncbi:MULTISPECIES: PilZ domain-containing protein [Pseudoalteromonas]|uniref:Pilus assembly protein PilZ n=1 Tax=Pseudoalteromonas amylolytica TaxID=1859457 RepID=A0A1S1MQ92_9GAMM|nr:MULTISPECIES: PilZ domain-containing protein [Pseudoalteromonas]OHU86581.1 pilus assembly protein PilZ [Pseudoalteromonas sp. JW3]OHU88894.1 pilus assembly protein PilZ [Pseudoalteromonas amylolytica]